MNVCALVLFQTAELAEQTAKITALEAARKRKEEEANSWQIRVRLNVYVLLTHTNNNLIIICAYFSCVRKSS